MHYALDAFFSLLCGNTSMVTQFFILNSFFCRAEILIGGAKGPPDKVSLQIFWIILQLLLCILLMLDTNLHVWLLFI